MHYSPSVAEAFNSIEHRNLHYIINYMCLFVCLSLFILIVNHLVRLAKNTFNISPLNNVVFELYYHR
jgi:hypothetical protein